MFYRNAGNGDISANWRGRHGGHLWNLTVFKRIFSINHDFNYRLAYCHLAVYAASLLLLVVYHRNKRCSTSTWWVWRTHISRALEPLATLCPRSPKKTLNTVNQHCCEVAWINIRFTPSDQYGRQQATNGWQVASWQINHLFVLK